jgi:hypothetical protein
LLEQQYGSMFGRERREDEGIASSSVVPIAASLTV